MMHSFYNIFTKNIYHFKMAYKGILGGPNVGPYLEEVNRLLENTDWC